MISNHRSKKLKIIYPKRINIKKQNKMDTPGHTIFKLMETKVREKFSKAARKKT